MGHLRLFASALPQPLFSIVSFEEPIVLKPYANIKSNSNKLPHVHGQIHRVYSSCESKHNNTHELSTWSTFQYLCVCLDWWNVPVRGRKCSTISGSLRFEGLGLSRLSGYLVFWSANLLICLNSYVISKYVCFWIHMTVCWLNSTIHQNGVSRVNIPLLDSFSHQLSFWTAGLSTVLIVLASLYTCYIPLLITSSNLQWRFQV